MNRVNTFRTSRLLLNNVYMTSVILYNINHNYCYRGYDQIQVFRFLY